MAINTYRQNQWGTNEIRFINIIIIGPFVLSVPHATNLAILTLNRTTYKRGIINIEHTICSFCWI